MCWPCSGRAGGRRGFVDHYWGGDDLVLVAVIVDVGYDVPVGPDLRVVEGFRGGGQGCPHAGFVGEHIVPVRQVVRRWPRRPGRWPQPRWRSGCSTGTNRWSVASSGTPIRSQNPAQNRSGCRGRPVAASGRPSDTGSPGLIARPGGAPGMPSMSNRSATEMDGAMVHMACAQQRGVDDGRFAGAFPVEQRGAHAAGQGDPGPAGRRTRGPVLPGSRCRTGSSCTTHRRGTDTSRRRNRPGRGRAADTGGRAAGDDDVRVEPANIVDGQPGAFQGTGQPVGQEHIGGSESLPKYSRPVGDFTSMAILRLPRLPISRMKSIWPRRLLGETADHQRTAGVTALDQLHLDDVGPQSASAAPAEGTCSPGMQSSTTRTPQSRHVTLSSDTSVPFCMSRGCGRRPAR